ncbi:alpha/beta fold hydrolase [Modestobacter sp. DSM 44400]|uniref:alpha/beta fold hydrolase n=1 Tax=Modestobacter sp. DSM 44400 TaxID=1550230 RepID=UPI001C312651
MLWRHVLPRLRGRCLAIEMTGYGTSIPDGVGRDLSLAAQADRLPRWVDVLGLEAPVPVGHDLGGGVAQIAAVRRPEACGGLVLTNAVCYDSWPTPAWPRCSTPHRCCATCPRPRSIRPSSS